MNHMRYNSRIIIQISSGVSGDLCIRIENSELYLFYFPFLFLFYFLFIFYSELKD